MRLLLIRHGQTPNNVTGALDTARPGADLTSLGRHQAAAVPGAVQGEQISAIYASPLTRTQSTAAPLVATLGVNTTTPPGLAEVPAGDFEMRNDHEAVHGYADCLLSWVTGDLTRTMPGGISGQDFWQQYNAAVADVAANHEPSCTVAIFTHGAAMRVYTALAAKLPPQHAADLRIANTGMSVLEGDPHSGWHLQQWIGNPLGGAHLPDSQAHDVTGESADEATHDSA